MIIMTNLQRAKDMEIPRQYAVMCRQRYITARQEEIDNLLMLLATWHGLDDVNAALVDPEVCALLIEKCRLIEEAHYMKTKMNRIPAITDDMVEQARQVPIDQVIEFHHGKAKAFCHDDNNPSLFHATRTNRAICPVCDRGFDTIGVLMHRDGMTFIDAVRSLCHV